MTHILARHYQLAGFQKHSVSTYCDKPASRQAVPSRPVITPGAAPDRAPCLLPRLHPISVNTHRIVRARSWYYTSSTTQSSTSHLTAGPASLRGSLTLVQLYVLHRSGGHLHVLAWIRRLGPIRLMGACEHEAIRRHLYVHD